ncbi:MAG TPA: nuclear transport factor 2 family protein [Myxococcota bacterium]|nr:nuclear transport factor 2 family protein [Myxococcota bacterium]
MNEIERLIAIEEIKQAKARYFRGVDTADTALVKGVLADDCVLDYNGCCVDPASGRDFLPAMNVVMRGSASWTSSALSSAGIVSVHHSHNAEVTLTGDNSADAIWSMTDRLYLPVGAPYSLMTGFGYYHETWVKTDGAWRIKTLRISRLRVEAI